MPKEEKGFRGVSLKAELVREVEKYIKDHPEYKGIADFVHEAIRVRMEELRQSYNQPRFEHFNINDDGVRITDRELGRIADLYFKPQGIFCDLDKTDRCKHIDFAFTVPKIRAILKQHIKEGWKIDLPDE